MSKTMPRRYHAEHESSHAVVGIDSGLMPTILEVGRTTRGTDGGVEFPRDELRSDVERWLLIAVAGRVGTRLRGWKNRLVSEQLAQFGDREPPDGSDAQRVWEDSFPLSEVRASERRARQILRKRSALLCLVADALRAKGSLTKREIAALVRKPDGQENHRNQRRGSGS